MKSTPSATLLELTSGGGRFRLTGGDALLSRRLFFAAGEDFTTVENLKGSISRRQGGCGVSSTEDYVGIVRFEKRLCCTEMRLLEGGRLTCSGEEKT